MLLLHKTLPPINIQPQQSKCYLLYQLGAIQIFQNKMINCDWTIKMLVKIWYTKTLKSENLNGGSHFKRMPQDGVQWQKSCKSGKNCIRSEILKQRTCLLLSCGMLHHVDIYQGFGRRTVSLFFYPEDRSSRFLQNIGNGLPDYTVSHFERILKNEWHIYREWILMNFRHLNFAINISS